MQYGTLFLNKIIESGDTKAIIRHDITLQDMPTESERKAFAFIEEYSATNGGQAPSYATVVSECPDFDYVPEVSDSFEYLARRVKENSAKIAIISMFEPKGNEPSKIDRKFRELDGNSFIDWLISEAERIKIRTSVRSVIGTDVKMDSEKFLAEYERRKEGKSFRIWKSKFQLMPDYISGNVYVVYGKSGRGKSVITLEEAIELASQGANVLVWAMEMPTFEVMVRLYVSLSARHGLVNANIDGVDMSAGFDSSALRNGKLGEDFELAFRKFLGEINDILPGNIIVRGVDDEDFNVRNLKALEADILATEADVVVIDPFYYLDYERNTSKTTGGDAAATSMKLRRLAGKTQTVIFAITQADEGREGEGDDGGRELKLPDRADVKKTKQLLEDAYLLIAVDTDYLQKRGLIGINKGRDGSEGTSAEIIYIPQVGIVNQPEIGEGAIAQFDF